MKEKYKITEKQLTFLSDFLTRKEHENDEIKLELMDHLICEFEEKGNGNLSEFLSNKLEFISGYKQKHQNIISQVYKKELIGEFKKYFLNLDKFPITLISLFVMYFVTANFNSKVTLIITIISFASVLAYIYSVVFFTKKFIRKTTSMVALTSTIWLPSIFIYLPKEFYNFLLTHKTLYLLFWFVAFIINLSAASYIKRKKETIKTKYQHLL
jgi:magnesium-transporting ATPase (P-type)